MKLIELVKTEKYNEQNFTMVDDEDYDKLSNFKWHIHKAPHTSYVFYEIKRKRVFIFLSEKPIRL